MPRGSVWSSAKDEARDMMDWNSNGLRYRAMRKFMSNDRAKEQQARRYRDKPGCRG